MMSAEPTNLRPVWGLAGFIFGVLALVVVTFHISGTFSEPEPSAATQIGEVAAELRESAKRALSREERSAKPAPAPSARDMTSILLVVVPILASIAAILGAIGLFRREAPTLSAIAITMGCSAFVMQYLFWLTIIIGGIVLLVVIVQNLDSILGG